MPNDYKNNNKNNKPKSQEEMQQELNKLNADEKAAEERAKAEKQRKDTEAKLEKARKKAEKRKRAEEKAAKKRAKEDADARAGKKKEKLFDRGFLPAVGFALGAAVGAILGYSIVIAPFLIASFFSAAVKFTIWGGKKAARAYRSFNEAKKIGAKKAEEKEKEESKKSEKELDKTIEKEKNKVVDSSLNKQKANEQDVMIEMVDMTGKAAQEEKNDPVKYQLKIARHDETAAMQMSINEKNFGEKKGEFVKHLANVAVLKSLEMAAKDGKEIPVDAINQANIDKLSEDFAKKDPFKSMSDGIKTPADIEKFKKLASENESGGLIDEMNKHMPKAEQEKKAPKKENVLQKQQQQPQMIGPM